MAKRARQAFTLPTGENALRANRVLPAVSAPAPQTLQLPSMLRTERLILRPPQLADARGMLESYARDPEVARYLTEKPKRDLIEALSHLQLLLENWQYGREYHWFITQAGGRGHCVGAVPCRIDQHRAEIQVMLARELWGQGYATEAVIAVRKWLEDQAHIHRIWAASDTEHPSITRVLHKAGFQHEGTLKAWNVYPNLSTLPRDCNIFAWTRNTS